MKQDRETYELILESDPNWTPIESRRNASLEQIVSECTDLKNNLHQILSVSRARRYELLGKIYELAFEAKHHPDEFMTLATKEGLSMNSRTDLFLVAIKLINGDKPSRRSQNSEWASALRYMYYEKTIPAEVPQKLHDEGGTRGAADKYAKLTKPRREPSSKKPLKKPSISFLRVWGRLVGRKPIARARVLKGKLKKGKAILIATVRKDGDLVIYRRLNFRKSPYLELVHQIAGALSVRKGNGK